METSPIPPPDPLRIAIVGLGRVGLYHLERLSLRDDCRPIVACDSDPAAAECVSDLGCRFCADWHEVLSADDVECVLIAVPPEAQADIAIAALQAGKHVAITTLAGTSYEAAGRMLAASRKARRALVALRTRRDDDDFHQALAVKQSGGLGELRAIKFVVWDYAIPIEGVYPRRPAQLPPVDDALSQFGADSFDQLLRLVGDDPRTVYCVTGPSSSTASAGSKSFLAVILFVNGVTAQVEVNLDSPVRFHSGWILTGTQGGYRNSRQSVLTGEGEIFDAPVERESPALEGLYDDLWHACRADGPLDDSFHTARRVLTLIEAAKESVRTGQVVDWLPPAAY